MSFLSAKTERIMRTLPCAIYLLALGWFSLQPQAAMPQDISDTLLHLVVYAGAAVLWGWATTTRRGLMLGLPLLIVYGIELELAQGLTPDRNPSVVDAVANSLGVVLGMGLLLLLQRVDALRRILLFPSRDW